MQAELRDVVECRVQPCARAGFSVAEQSRATRLLDALSLRAVERLNRAVESDSPSSSKISVIAVEWARAVPLRLGRRD